MLIYLKSPHRYKLVVVVAILLNTLSACTGSNQVSEESSTSEINLLVPSVWESISEAERLALNWNSAARLMQIQVEIVNGSTSFIKHPSIILTYNAEEIINETFGVFCKSGKCRGESFPIPSTLMSLGVTPIPIDLVKTDSTEAVQIALENGGLKYLQSQEDFDLANLRFDEEGNLYWVIRLDAKDGGFLVITIDASTGEVINLIEN